MTVTRKTEHLGDERGGPGSDRFLSPSRPQTGDGRTTRQPHDPVKLDKPKK